MKIYLDNSGTTKVLPQAVKKMVPILTEKYGNPSSTHPMGVEAREELEAARRIIAESLHAEMDEIIFTSGATEANNMALLGLAAGAGARRRVLVSPIEHPSVTGPVARLAEMGFSVEKLRVDAEGFLDLDHLKNTLDEDTLVVSVIGANHEIGTVQDLPAIAALCEERGAVFHSDMADGFGKTPLDVRSLGRALVTLSSHKIHGPKGVGALYARRGIALRKVYEGAPQEAGRRSGVENVAGIVGFAEAARFAFEDYGARIEGLVALRDRLLDAVIATGLDVRLNGPPRGGRRLPHHTSLAFRGTQARALARLLAEEGICVSAGSAYYSRYGGTSPILAALGLEGNDLENALRICVSMFTTEEEISHAASALKQLAPAAAC